MRVRAITESRSQQETAVPCSPQLNYELSQSQSAVSLYRPQPRSGNHHSFYAPSEMTSVTSCPHAAQVSINSYVDHDGKAAADTNEH